MISRRSFDMCQSFQPNPNRAKAENRLIGCGKPISVSVYACSSDAVEINEPLGIECLHSALLHRFGEDVDVIVATSPEEAVGKDVILVSMQAPSPDVGRIYAGKGDSLVSIGGAHPTTYAQQVLEEFPEAVVVVGEGEESTCSLVGALMVARQNGKGFDRDVLYSIPNIAFTSGSKIVSTGRFVGNLPLRCLPMKRDALGSTLVSNGIARIESGRGCDYGACTFCTVPWKYGGRKSRRYTMERIRADLIALSGAGAKSVAFTDEEFIGLDPAFTHGLVDWILESKESGILSPEIRFMASVSVRITMRDGWDHGGNKKLLRKMAKAGFDSLFVGIESGSATQLKRYGKGVTPRENAAFLSFLKSIGINADIGFIMFDPLMTFDELKENIRFIRENDLERSTARVIKRMFLLPGTKYSEMFQRVTGMGLPDRLEETETWMFVDSSVREVLNRFGSSKDEMDYVIQADMRTGGADYKTLKRLTGNRRDDFDRLVSIVGEVDGNANSTYSVRRRNSIYAEKGASTGN